MKLLTYIIGTPDEIASLFDKSAKTRKEWDLGCTDCKPVKDSCFTVSYGSYSEKKEYVSAMVKGSFLVLEKVNDSEQVNIFVF